MVQDKHSEQQRYWLVPAWPVKWWSKHAAVMFVSQAKPSAMKYLTFDDVCM